MSEFCVGQNASYESTKPLAAWIGNLVSRVVFFNTWCCRVVDAAYRAVKPPKAPVVKAQHRSDDVKPDESLTSEVDVKASELKPLVAASPPLPPAAPPKTPEDVRIHPRSYWLPSFFFPQGFLTAVLQMHARKLGVSVDSLAFEFHIANIRESEDSLIDIKQQLDIRDLAYQVSSRHLAYEFPRPRLQGEFPRPRLRGQCPLHSQPHLTLSVTSLEIHNTCLVFVNTFV